MAGTLSMCGIAGVAGSISAAHALNTVIRMNAAQIHRGPDDSGEWSEDGIGFGMRRLSIIDLAGGHQPMWSENGVAIIFNGEIYNYQALRTELICNGYIFRTHSDTEVILHLYHRDGLAFIGRLEGMFAIFLYDRGNNIIHLIRDRLGKKPLYYGMKNGLFYFASEIKALLAGMTERPEVNLSAIHHFLTLRFIPSHLTVWEDIQKLGPAHRLSLCLATGHFKIQRYWQLTFHSQTIDPDRDYPKEFEQLFLQAVEKRLLASDVPVGILLSGGLDSSAIAAAALELGHHDTHTFSVYFHGHPQYDERPYANQVAKYLGAQHHEIGIDSKAFLDLLPQMVRDTDEPLADLASIPLYYVSKMARSSVKVALSGEGADEILAGYNFDKLALLLHWLRWLEQVPGALSAISGLARHTRAQKFIAAQRSAGWQNILSAQPYHMTNYWAENEKRMLWHDCFGPFPDTQQLIQSWHAESDQEAHPLDRLQQVYCKEWLTEDLLMKADKMSMSASLELRTPFLDHTLAEWAAALPLAYKVGDNRNGFSSKKILRQFSARRLPLAIINRPKQGFPVPAYDWLKDEAGSWASSLLDRHARINDYFKSEIVQTTLAAARNGNHSAAHRVWILIILELWLREWA